MQHNVDRFYFDWVTYAITQTDAIVTSICSIVRWITAIMTRIYANRLWIDEIGEAYDRLAIDKLFQVYTKIHYGNLKYH